MGKYFLKVQTFTERADKVKYEFTVANPGQATKIGTKREIETVRDKMIEHFIKNKIPMEEYCIWILTV